MKETVRFLHPDEYSRTIPLFIECFGEDPEFMEEYYGTKEKPGRVQKGRIAVLEISGEKRPDPAFSGARLPNEGDTAADAATEPSIVSMVHLQPATASCKDRQIPVTYIMGVATSKACRHRGYMDRVMELVLDTLKEEEEDWCFLIAVDKAIYRHLQFDYDWELSEQEAECFYADEGLHEGTARLLAADVFLTPDTVAFA